MNNQIFRKCLCFIFGFLTTVIIIGPLILWIDKLELSGKINPPDWLVMPAVLGIVALFICITGQYARFLLSDDRKKDSAEKIEEIISNTACEDDNLKH